MANSPVRVLVVEDDPIIGLDLTQSLAGFGYEVSGPITTGEEAVERFADLKPNAVVMDINLKGKMDGVEAGVRLLDIHPVPVIFLTGQTDEETLQRAKLARPYGYLIKPFDSTELRTTLEVTLNQFQLSQDKSHPAIEEELFSDQIDISDRAAVINEIPLFRELPEKVRASLAAASVLKSLDAGQYLMEEEESPDGSFVLLSGRMSATKSTVSGKELIVSLLAPGDTFGLFFLFQPFEGACAVRAQIDSRVLWIGKEELKAAMKGNPEMVARMAELLSGRLVAAYELARSLAHSRVEDRIVTTLLTLLPKFGKGSATQKGSERIFITRRELADLTGTTPETAIRVTKQLERDGLLDLTRPGIIKILDATALRGHAESH